MRPLILLGCLAAGTARAGWGPFAGGAILATNDPSVGRFTGWEAGLTLADATDKGFWQFGGGRGSSHVDHAQLTWAQARLNFRASSTRASMFYAGGGASLDWLDHQQSSKRLWIVSTQAGIMVAPDRLWSLATGRTGPSLMDSPHAPKEDKNLMSSHVLLGLEAGYHLGRLSLSGLDSRAYLTITY